MRRLGDRAGRRRAQSATPLVTGPHIGAWQSAQPRPGGRRAVAGLQVARGTCSEGSHSVTEPPGHLSAAKQCGSELTCGRGKRPFVG